MAEKIPVTYSVGPGQMIFLANLVREKATHCHEGEARYYKEVCKSIYPDVHLSVDPAPDAGENWAKITVLSEYRVVKLPQWQGGLGVRFVVGPAASAELDSLGETIFRDWAESEGALKDSLLANKSWARPVREVEGFTLEEYMAATA